MIEIRKIRRKDYKKAQQFAVTGMHFDWYMDSKILLSLYAKYFWNMEFNRATKVYGAYVDGQFAGVLLADMKGEPKQYYSIWRAAYRKVFEVLQHLAVGNGVGEYENANRKMFASYCEKQTPDGEIVFLAADPECKVKGIGTALLSAFEQEEKGKRVYLYTDHACTYQFYEHRGFERVEEENIVLALGKKNVPLTCFIYSKVIIGQPMGGYAG